MDSLIRLFNEQDFHKATIEVEKFIQKYPNLSFGYKMKGTLALQQKDLETGLKYLSIASKINPEAETYNSLGVAYRGLKKYDDAITAFQTAITLDSSYADSYSNLGNTLGDLGRHKEAAEALKKAIERKPNFLKAYNNYANALLNLGQYSIARDFAKKALDLDPGYLEAYINLGAALNHLGHPNEAISAYKKAIEINPEYAVPYNNLGALYQQRGLLMQSLEYLELALAKGGGTIPVFNNLGLTLSALGRWDEAYEYQKKAFEMYPEAFQMRSGVLFSLNFSHHFDVKKYLSEATSFATTARKSAHPFYHWVDKENPSELKKLKIGFVSGDFNRHPVAFFTEGLFSALSKRKDISIHAYYSNTKFDQVTERLKPLFTEWTDIYGWHDREVAQTIHDTGIHILIDLSGHTAFNRLPVFAYKPAPIQASWLGYFASTGMEEIDYFIGDRYMHPENEEWHFVEKPWRLPRLWPFTNDCDVSVSPLPAIKNGYVTFGSFNKLQKMTDQVVALWSRILLAIPNSRLILNASELSEPLNIERTIQRYAAFGISSDRLTLLDWRRSRTEHLAIYHQVDIALDPFPYMGGTTSNEALWMGVPVLTKKGDRYLSHIGESLMCSAGLPGFVASDEDDYLKKAVALTQNLDYLSLIRANLRSHLASSLFDAEQFSIIFTDMLWRMWRGEPNNSAPSGNEKNVVLSLYNNKNFEELFKEAEILIKKYPTNSFGHKVMGIVLIERSQPELAIPYLEKARSLDPNDVEIIINLSAALLHLKNPKLAISCCLEAIMLNPANIVSWYNLQNAYIETGHYPQAISAGLKVVELAPEFSMGWSRLAVAYERNHQYKDAELCLSKVKHLSIEVA